MNQVTRNIWLLLVTLSVACVTEVGAPEPGEELPGAPPAAASASPDRAGTPFRSKVRDHLAARGVKVHTPEGERTTVEQAWKVAGNPHQIVEGPAPATTPHQYAVHFEIRLPLIQYVDKVPTVVGGAPDPIRWDSCSGTLVGEDSVLTAAHCMVGWEEIGMGLEDKQPRIERVPTYSMLARARRNGVGIAGVDDEVPEEIGVKHGLWDFSNWPGPESEKTIYKQEHDYGVAKLKERTEFGVASTRVVAGTPAGKQIAAAHYPNARARLYRMYYSEGVVDEASPSGSNTYSHNAQAEVGSSGSGVFERNASGVIAGVVGLQTSMRGPHIDIPKNKYDAKGQDQVYPVRLDDKFPDTPAGEAERAREYRNRRFPNFALFFTNTTRDTVNGWIAD